jgi:hypothetical protein
MNIGFISPFVSIILAFVFFIIHCNRIEPERRISAVAYALSVIICGGIGGCAGLIFGIQQACSTPTSSNLCGLWGFFVTGPISFALAIFIVGLALFLVRPRQSGTGA